MERDPLRPAGIMKLTDVRSQKGFGVNPHHSEIAPFFSYLGGTLCLNLCTNPYEIETLTDTRTDTRITESVRGIVKRRVGCGGSERSQRTVLSFRVRLSALAGEPTTLGILRG